jgi:hypothetical protein
LIVGSQLDSVTATLEALPECVEAAAGRIPVHIDSGFRRGTDIFKVSLRGCRRGGSSAEVVKTRQLINRFRFQALALGADHVWVGRAVLWGLAVSTIIFYGVGLPMELNNCVIYLLISSTTVKPASIWLSAFLLTSSRRPWRYPGECLHAWFALGIPSDWNQLAYCLGHVLALMTRCASLAHITKAHLGVVGRNGEYHRL